MAGVYRGQIYVQTKTAGHEWVRVTRVIDHLVVNMLPKDTAVFTFEEWREFASAVETLINEHLTKQRVREDADMGGNA